MPSSYAHHRFGVLILPGLPADVRRPIQRFRHLFDLGLQGPDFFFFGGYLSGSHVSELGNYFHNQSGRDFFTHCCEVVHQHPSEEALAYLCGLLGHYCLDSVCHPFVYERTDTGPVGHTELETDFDRYLLCLDGDPKPYRYHVPHCKKLSQKDYTIIASFYPDVTAQQIRQCVHIMDLANAVLAAGQPVRSLVSAFLKLSSGDAKGMYRSNTANPNCAMLIEPLYTRYNHALAQFPDYLEQLRDHLTYNAPLGDIFTATFNHET